MPKDYLIEDRDGGVHIVRQAELFTMPPGQLQGVFDHERNFCSSSPPTDDIEENFPREVLKLQSFVTRPAIPSDRELTILLNPYDLIKTLKILYGPAIALSEQEQVSLPLYLYDALSKNFPEKVLPPQPSVDQGEISFEKMVVSSRRPLYEIIQPREQAEQEARSENHFLARKLNEFAILTALADADMLNLGKNPSLLEVRNALRLIYPLNRDEQNPLTSIDTSKIIKKYGANWIRHEDPEFISLCIIVRDILFNPSFSNLNQSEKTRLLFEVYRASRINTQDDKKNSVSYDGIYTEAVEEVLGGEQLADFAGSVVREMKPGDRIIFGPQISSKINFGNFFWSLTNILREQYGCFIEKGHIDNMLNAARFIFRYNPDLMIIQDGQVILLDGSEGNTLDDKFSRIIDLLKHISVANLINDTRMPDYPGIIEIPGNIPIERDIDEALSTPIKFIKFKNKIVDITFDPHNEDFDILLNSLFHIIAKSILHKPTIAENLRRKDNAKITTSLSHAILYSGIISTDVSLVVNSLRNGGKDFIQLLEEINQRNFIEELRNGTPRGNESVTICDLISAFSEERTELEISGLTNGSRPQDAYKQTLHWEIILPRLRYGES